MERQCGRDTCLLPVDIRREWIEGWTTGFHEDAVACTRAYGRGQSRREPSLVSLCLDDVGAQTLLDGLPDAQRQFLPAQPCTLGSLHTEWYEMDPAQEPSTARRNGYGLPTAL